MKIKKSIDILGAKYSLNIKNYIEDPKFMSKEMLGYCDMCSKYIAVCDMTSFPGYEVMDPKGVEDLMKEIFRHELIHAFLYESGLNNSSLSFEDGWATNEEMVDWFAVQAPKIFSVYKELDLL